MLLPPLSDSGEIIKKHQDCNDALTPTNQDSGEKKDNQDSGEHRALTENVKGNMKGQKQTKKQRKKKIRYLIKGMTRDEYNE